MKLAIWTFLVCVTYIRLCTSEHLSEVHKDQTTKGLNRNDGYRESSSKSEETHDNDGGDDNFKDINDESTAQSKAIDNNDNEEKQLKMFDNENNKDENRNKRRKRKVIKLVEEDDAEDLKRKKDENKNKNDKKDDKSDKTDKKDISDTTNQKDKSDKINQKDESDKTNQKDKSDKTDQKDKIDKYNGKNKNDFNDINKLKTKNKKLKSYIPDMTEHWLMYAVSVGTYILLLIILWYIICSMSTTFGYERNLTKQHSCGE